MFPKGDIPHIRYLLDKKTHLAYRRLMKTLHSSLAFESSNPAQFRLHAIEHYSKYGLASTMDAFNIKRSTFYYWKKKYEDSGRKLVSLVPQSTCPKSVRKMEVDWRLVVFIEQVRKKYGNVGARIIKPFLDEYAKSLSINSIARTTIEKVIRRHKLTFEIRKKAKRKTKYQKLRTRKSPQVKEPGYIEADTIEIRVFGKKYYFISIIDIFTRLAYVEWLKTRSSEHTRDAFKRYRATYQHHIHTVQTDNGGEFLKRFHQYLEDQSIKHVFIYPNSPKINGIVERFNRTIQEEFINRSEDFGANDERFIEKLTNYLNWYNRKRPHSSLGYQSPMQFMQARV